MEHATPELFAALARAQKDIQNPRKDSKNPHFRSEYASLPEVIEKIREVFPTHGLCMIQSTAFDGSVVSVTTVISHDKGGYIASTASAGTGAKVDAQTVGSATTYLRRYGAAAMAFIAQADDDGNAATEAAKGATPARGAKMPYPDESIESNRETWIKMIKSGKATPRSLIGMILSRYELSPEQIKQIEGLTAEDAADE